MDRKKELLWRAYLVMFGFIIATGLILFKIFNITFIERDKWKQQGEANVQWRIVDADRGNIYAEESNLLATSLQFFEVRMDLTMVKNDIFKKEVDSLALFLSNFKEGNSSKTKEQWKKDLISAKNKGNGYFYIAKGLDIEAYNKLKKAPILKYGKYRGGLIDVRYGKRVKPYRELASRTIGVDRENADRIGLEGYFDKFLKGKTDKRLMKRLPINFGEKDVWVPVFDPSENVISRGSDIISTINVDMQDIVHHELYEGISSLNAEGGVAILMETKTGAIKAISNLTRAEDGFYYEMYNQAAGRLSEPGSTMKLATMLALMEDGLTNVDTVININYGVRQFSDRTMHDSEKHGKKYATMQEIFEISSNVGTAALANDVYNSVEGRKRWIKRLKQFGLHEPTGIDISGEATPEIKDPVKNKNSWYGTTIPWMAHGYELMMTPLQVLNFYNAVANNGTLMKPYLVSEIRNGDETVKVFEPTALIHQIAKPENIKKARFMMEGVVQRGTAKSIKSKYLNFAGKTGTARTNYANSSEYAKYNASFCGYFPAENPMYTMIVVVYDPKNVYYGGAAAGPIFKNAAEKVYALKTKQARLISDSLQVLAQLPIAAVGKSIDFKNIFKSIDIKSDINTSSEWVQVKPSEGTIQFNKKTISKSVVPNVIGMGARDAVYLLEQIGLKVKINGAGKVTHQSIQHGVSAKGQTIYLSLS
ncbi:MAG: penicillin-binding protein [Saprospiraceae bacterium]